MNSIVLKILTKYTVYRRIIHLNFQIEGTIIIFKMKRNMIYGLHHVNGM